MNSRTVAFIILSFLLGLLLGYHSQSCDCSNSTPNVGITEPPAQVDTLMTE